MKGHPRMGKIGFLYPGQGSQKPGMGKELAQAQPALFEKYLLQSDRISGEPVSQLCLEGPAESLNQTHIAQPALFAYSLALTDYASQLGLQPDLVAGHSLGEYTAAVAAGVISFQEGLSLVCTRGRLMKQIQNERPGAMAAVFGLPKATLDALCRAISQRDMLLVTNWNAPEQLVVSGTERGVKRLIEVFRVRSGGTVIRLPVQGAFHSPLMETVREAIDDLTGGLYWNNPLIPLAANVSGDLLTQGQQVRQELIEQITSPVQWVSCIKTLIAEGCDQFIELGSGQVLTKLVRLIEPGVTAIALDTPEKVEAYVESSRTTSRREHSQAA